MIRLPFAPLLAVSGADTVRAFAALIDADRRQVGRAKRDGLSWLTADRWAVKVGWHPANIWGTDAWLDTVAVECANGHVYTDRDWDTTGRRACHACQDDRRQERRQQGLREQIEVAA
jgi:hypothetical protein